MQTPPLEPPENGLDLVNSYLNDILSEPDIAEGILGKSPLNVLSLNVLPPVVVYSLGKEELLADEERMGGETEPSSWYYLISAGPTDPFDPETFSAFACISLKVQKKPRVLGVFRTPWAKKLVIALNKCVELLGGEPVIGEHSFNSKLIRILQDMEPTMNSASGPIPVNQVILVHASKSEEGETTEYFFLVSGDYGSLNPMQCYTGQEFREAIQNVAGETSE